MYLASEGIRIKEQFNDDWYFYHDKDNKGNDKQVGNFDAINYRKVKLPHDWSLEYPFDENADSCGSGGYVETGIGWYKKIFKVSKKHLAGGRIFINFDGAYMNTSVWINGIYLGNHVYGYTPFRYEVTDFINTDGSDNVIDVKIDNSQQPNSRWYSGSGITRNVWIEKTNSLFIKQYGVWFQAVNVTKNLADIKIETSIENNKSAAGKIEVETELVSDKGESCLKLKSVRKKEMNVICHEGKIENPILWDIDNPYLYTLVTRLYENGVLMDELFMKIGIRSTEFHKDKGFFLNGRHVKLNGVCLHHDGGCMGAAVPRQIWQRRLEKLKQMGANAVRTSHNPPDSELLELCDSMGFLVMDEAFDEWRYVKGKELGSNTHESRGYSDWFDECHEDDLRTMLLRDRNHPSIIMWSIGNEVPDQTDKNGHFTARKLKNICKSLDALRPVTQANDQIFAEPKAARMEFLNELDIVGYNYAGRWRNRAETFYENDRIEHPDWYIIGTENSSLGGVRGKYIMTTDECDNWWKRPYYSAPVEIGKLLRFTMTRDYVAGDFMWTGVDHLGESHWPERSSSTGVLDTCGFEKDSYYFYKSIWDRKNPMVHILPHWNVEVESGKIIPVIGYTNCESAELFLNGKSYGRKSGTYPAYGMTLTYGHFDKTPVAANTDDLFLSWDVPYEQGVIEIVGYCGGKEAARETVKTAKEPYALKMDCYEPHLSANGFDVGQIEISVVDKEGNLCYQSDIEITVTVDKAADIIGIDNGNPKSHESMKTNHIHAFSGKAFCVIQSDKTVEKCIVRAEAKGLEAGSVVLEFEKIV